MERRNYRNTCARSWMLVGSSLVRGISTPKSIGELCGQNGSENSHLRKRGAEARVYLGLDRSLPERRHEGQ